MYVNIYVCVCVCVPDLYNKVYHMCNCKNVIKLGGMISFECCNMYVLVRMYGFFLLCVRVCVKCFNVSSKRRENFVRVWM